MKISKSKQELARIISENGGWRDGEFAAQDGDGGVGGYEVKPEWDSLAKYWWREASGQWFFANKIKNHHQTVLSRAEYFHLYPAPGVDGWIELDGKHEPEISTSGLTIWCKWSDGLEQCHEANMVDWIDDSDVRVVAYRLHKQSEPEFCESVMRSTPEPEVKPTIEQLAADYRNKLDYANRKQDEADKANMESDAALAQLEDAIAEIGFVITPLAATEKEPELVITDWCQLKVGDLVEITTTRDGVNIGEAATVIAIDENNEDFRVTVTFPEDKYPLEYSYERPPTTWRFIRRPQQQGDSMKFKTVAEYYSYMAQGNCCAPKFEDLHDSAKAYWVEDFQKYNNEAEVYSE